MIQKLHSQWMIIGQSLSSHLRMGKGSLAVCLWKSIIWKINLEHLYPFSSLNYYSLPCAFPLRAPKAEGVMPMCTCLTCLHVLHACRCLQRPEGVGSSWTGVSVGSELPGVGAGSQTWLQQSGNPAVLSSSCSRPRDLLLKALLWDKTWIKNDLLNFFPTVNI